MRRAAKVDVNQREIVNGLRHLGCTVYSLSAVGQGCPDLLCGHAGKTYLLEVKTRTGRLTPDEITWHENWLGQVAVVRTLEEAADAVGVWIL